LAIGQFRIHNVGAISNFEGAPAAWLEAGEAAPSSDGLDPTGARLERVTNATADLGAMRRRLRLESPRATPTLRNSALSLPMLR